VRIRETPEEREVDGVKLDRLTPGRVCDVSSSIGSWLLTERYAQLEMRTPPPYSGHEFDGRGFGPSEHAADRRSRPRDRRRASGN
jgi:hypothetical protein